MWGVAKRRPVDVSTQVLDSSAGEDAPSRRGETESCADATETLPASDVWAARRQETLPKRRASVRRRRGRSRVPSNATDCRPATSVARIWPARGYIDISTRVPNSSARNDAPSSRRGVKSFPDTTEMLPASEIRAERRRATLPRRRGRLHDHRERSRTTTEAVSHRSVGVG